ncbi:MAG: helix-turn-helix domain-containing protein, partial [Bacteroidota bacterium]
YLARQKSCMSGNIAEELPLSRTTVSQHLQELKKGGLIKGEIEGTRVNYCLNPENIQKTQQLLALFFQEVKQSSENCDC